MSPYVLNSVRLAAGLSELDLILIFFLLVFANRVRISSYLSCTQLERSYVCKKYG